MKKLYIQPTLDVIALRPMRLMAGSEKLYLNSSTPYEEGTTIEAKSGFGGWDDDVEPGEDF